MMDNDEYSKACDELVRLAVTVSDGTEDQIDANADAIFSAYDSLRIAYNNWVAA